MSPRPVEECEEKSAVNPKKTRLLPDIPGLSLYVEYNFYNESSPFHINTVAHIHTWELVSILLHSIGIPGHVPDTE